LAKPKPEKKQSSGSGKFEIGDVFRARPLNPIPSHRPLKQGSCAMRKTAAEYEIFALEVSDEALEKNGARPE
jgi:hypothetical protein